MRAPRRLHRTRPGPGTCRPSGRGRRLEGPLFRRGALSRLPGTVLRCTPAARHRARPCTTVSTSPNSIRCTITSTTPNSRSATSSSTTACTTAPGAPSRRCSKAPSMKPCETRPRSGSPASTSRRVSSTMRCTRWRGSRARCPRRSGTTSSSCGRTSTWRQAGRARPSRCSSSCRATRAWPGSSPTTSASRCCRTVDTQEAIEQLDKAGQLQAGDRRRSRDPRQVQPGARHHPVRIGRLRAGEAVAGPRPPRGTVLEPGSAAGRLGRGLGRALRPCARSVEHPGGSRADGCRGPGSHARRAARVRQPEPARPRRAHVRARARAVQQPDRKSRRIDRQHPGRAVSQGADPRGEPAGRGLGHPPAQPARCAGNLLPDGADGVSRLPDRAAELPRPRGPAVEAHRRGRPASMLSTTSSDCADRTTSRCCRRSTRSSGSWIRGCACASSSASTSASACRRC